MRDAVKISLQMVSGSTSPLQGTQETEERLRNQVLSFTGITYKFIGICIEGIIIEIIDLYQGSIIQGSGSY